jgi:hypothetical protein
MQAYNILNMVDILEFADRFGAKVELLDFLVGPSQLAHQVMPPQVRTVALERVRRYRARACRPWNCEAVDSLVAHLERTMGEFHSDLLPQFMRFTNQLDRIHGQSFRESQAELFGLIEASGFRWIDDGLEDAAA